MMELFVAGCSTSWTERATSCYIVNNHILFDCGEGTVKNITKCLGEKVVKGIDTIFLTHFHSDHLFGITPYIAQILNGYAKVPEKLTIIGPKGLKKIIKFFIPNHVYSGKVDWKKKLVLKEIKTFNEKFVVDDIEVSCHKLNHGNLCDVGYLIKTKDGVLGYTGDCIYDKNLQAFIEKCNTAICDVSSEKDNYAHMGVQGYTKLKKEFPNKKLFAVHCSNEVYTQAKKFGLTLLKEQTFYDFDGKTLIKK